MRARWQGPEARRSRLGHRRSFGWHRGAWGGARRGGALGAGVSGGGGGCDDFDSELSVLFRSRADGVRGAEGGGDCGGWRWGAVALIAVPGQVAASPSFGTKRARTTPGSEATN